MLTQWCPTSDAVSSTFQIRHGQHRFDPVVVGHRECEAWAAYYRREWIRFLISAIGLVRAAFGMRADQTLRGAWYVMRANQVWAAKNHDLDAARKLMRRFYGLIIRSHGMDVDPDRAAGLEVQWWIAHRHRQSGIAPGDETLIDCMNALYVYLYRVDPSVTRRVAELRVAAMDVSDSWVVAGCDRRHPDLATERRLLVDSYTALRQLLDDIASPPPLDSDVIVTLA